jgi:hypothetical protein
VAVRYEEIAVDMTSDIAEFLTSRRAKITPIQAGLPSYGKRRVPGLRREEVASLAGEFRTRSAEPDSASQQALDLLASWAATPPARATIN